MFAHGLPAEKDEYRALNALPFSISIKIHEDVEGVFSWFIRERWCMIAWSWNRCGLFQAIPPKLHLIVEIDTIPCPSIYQLSQVSYILPSIFLIYTIQ
jgi:hypothetical protein